MGKERKMLERQELYCHGCNGYVQFSLDISLNGIHTLNCPKCGHEHTRQVIDGKIGDAMRGSPGMVMHQASRATWTTTSTWDNYTTSDTSVTGGSTFLYTTWTNTGN